MTKQASTVTDFAEITQLIASARLRAVQAVNTTLIDLYWQVGQIISRMRQFYEAYQGDAIVSALLRQLPWTHNLIILNQSKRPEEREFYLRMAVREQWSSRQLERQLKTALFERTVLSPAKVSPRATDQLAEFFDRAGARLLLCGQPVSAAGRRAGLCA